MSRAAIKAQYQLHSKALEMEASLLLAEETLQQVQHLSRQAIRTLAPDSIDYKDAVLLAHCARQEVDLQRAELAKLTSIVRAHQYHVRASVAGTILKPWGIVCLLCLILLNLLQDALRHYRLQGDGVKKGR